MAGLVLWLVVGMAAATTGAEEAAEGLTREVLEREPLVTINIQTNQVFSLFLTPQYFNWSHTKGQVEYRASSLGGPALPAWLRQRALPARRSALLYGTPPRPGATRLQVVATDRHTFTTSLLAVTIRVEEAEPDAAQVNLKVDNLDIEDIFDFRRMDRLKEVFRNNLWPESHEDLHLAFAESYPMLGGRRPLHPGARDGVVLRLGSATNFSAALTALDRETTPLRRLPTCSFKRVSVERFFRAAGFAVDWCAFRLVQETEGEEVEVEREQGRRAIFPTRGPAERASRVRELLTAALLPIVIFLVFSGGLAAVLWAGCGEEKQRGGMFLESLFEVFDDCRVSRETSVLVTAAGGSVEGSPPPLAPASTTPTTAPSPPLRSPPTSRASSVQRQSDTLRCLGRRRDVTPRLHSSPPPHSPEGSSLHSRSRTASPGPTGPPAPSGGPGRQSLDWEMFESLNRPNPPAYGSLPRSGAR